jgi:peptide/nickel transport system permease protein
MRRYLLKRALQMVPTFLGITFLTFFAAQLAPGDPLQLDPEGATAQANAQQALDAFKHRHGLDQPLPVQYARWVGRVATLDFGRSLHDHRPVSELLAEALPRTLLLTVLALLLAFGLAVPLGVQGAVREGSLAARLVSGGLFAAYAMPAFWVAVLALLFFSSPRFLGALPFQGLTSDGFEALSAPAKLADLAKHLVLPVICLAYPTLAVVAVQVRAAMRAALAQDYVRAARARGIPERRVVYRHALRNSLLPLATLLGLTLPSLVGGSVVVERVFGIPGMGLLAFDAIANRDYPVVMGVATLVALVTMLSVLAADLLYAVADPRVRVGGEA